MTTFSWGECVGVSPLTLKKGATPASHLYLAVSLSSDRREEGAVCKRCHLLTVPQWSCPGDLSPGLVRARNRGGRPSASRLTHGGSGTPWSLVLHVPPARSRCHLSIKVPLPPHAPLIIHPGNERRKLVWGSYQGREDEQEKKNLKRSSHLLIPRPPSSSFPSLNSPNFFIPSY